MQEWKIIVPFPVVTKVEKYLEACILDITTGFTYTSGFGAWKDNDGNIIKEPNRIYYVALDEDKYDVFQFAREIRRQTGESCIYIVRTGEAYLV